MNNNNVLADHVGRLSFFCDEQEYSVACKQKPEHLGRVFWHIQAFLDPRYVKVGDVLINTRSAAKFGMQKKEIKACQDIPNFQAQVGERLGNITLKFTSWNIGSNSADFKLRNEGYQRAEGDAKETLSKNLEKRYAEIGQIAANNIFTDKAAIGAVVMLQENAFLEISQQRAEVTKLNTLGYELIDWAGDKVDQYGPGLSIAIDKEKFVENDQGSVVRNKFQLQCDNGSQAVAVIVQNADTRKLTALINIQVAGCEIRNDPQFDNENGAQGNEDCAAIINWINNELGHFDYVCIGGDFNASPEGMPTRFKLFENAGFTLLRTSQPTELNYQGCNLPDNPNTFNQRELDYFYVKTQPSPSLLQRVFRKQPKIICKIRPNALENMENHGSDHKLIQAGLVLK